jgi:DNA recombination protein RmuC
VAAALMSQCSEAEKARVAAETTLAEARKNLEEQKQALEQARSELSNIFKALANDALRGNSDEFLKLAREVFEKLMKQASGELGQRQVAIQALVEPLNKSLASIQEELVRVDTQVEVLARSNQELRAETGSLVTSLRQPQIKGKWGELTLRRLVELAGMAEHVDFVEQVSVETESGRLQPDMVVHVAGGLQIIVDAKVPLHSFLKAVNIRTQEEYHEAMEEHARLVRSHVLKLASKSYWEQFKTAPKFVVLYLPGESFFSAALEKDHSLIEYAIEKNVILASPTTLLALLRSVAAGWRVEQLARNAEEISEIGKQLHERIRVFVEHMNRIGAALDTANKAYNSAVGSLEQKLIPGGRKFKELGVQTTAEIPDAEPTETSLRSLAAGGEEGEG